MTARQLLEGGARAFEEDEDAPGSHPESRTWRNRRISKTPLSLCVVRVRFRRRFGFRLGPRRSGLKRRAEKPDDASAADSKTALGEFFGGDATKEDAFLRDYLLNRKWKEDETKLPTHGAVGYGSSSEEEVEEAEKFEQKYNFRFEEPDGGESTVSHARVVEGRCAKKNGASRRARRS